MNIKTIITVDGINVVDFGSSASRFYWVENLGSTTVYVSGNENIVPDGDNVKVLSAGCGTMIENLGGKVYILGAGKFQITNQGDKFPPFRNAPVADGGVMASGNPVQIDGMQGGVPFSEMVVSGKNLIPFPYYETTKTVNGITFTDNGDGTITANGTATATANFYISNDLSLKKGTYILSGRPKSASVNDYILQLATSDWSVRFSDSGDGKLINIDDDINFQIFRIAITNGVTVDNVIFRPQLELGTAPTAYEPPITGRDLTVGVCGKNLLPYPYADTTKTVNGITFTDNGDGTITANGTATANTTFKLSNNYMYKSGINYVVSGCPNGDGSAYKLKGNAEDVNADDVGNGKSFLFEKDTDCSICILIYRNATVDNLVFRPQLELGSTATPYESYHGIDYTITPTSNPYVIPNDIRQVDGRNVVSVSAGELSVTGVRKNAAVKKIWDKLDELTTAIIVSNGETIE